MPGLITHSKIFSESINLLQTKKKSHLFSKSIATLFQTPGFKNAGFFGSIGPNILDFIPREKKCSSFKSEISHVLHNGGSEKLLVSMINRIFAPEDYNNEWSATQRAYLYGFISHIITDSVFHPFIFYWAGFPTSSNKKKEIRYFREQHLLLEYSIDLFFDYLHGPERYNFNLMDMLQVKSSMSKFKIDPAIKDIMLGSLKKTYPGLFNRTKLSGSGKKDALYTGFEYFDIIPYYIKLTYWIKRTNLKYTVKLIESIKRKNLFYSDILVRYPEPKRMNRNVLNLHRERWLVPAGSSGLHYESVEDLFRISIERITGVWEKIESKLYGNERDILDLLDDVRVNAFTGENDISCDDMKEKNPARLHF